MNEANKVSKTNEGVDILKVSNYDGFKCTANKCRFTCCDGWDVSIDDDTYSKWKEKSDECDYILTNIKMKNCGSERSYFINKETHESCPFLDNKGLCNIVKSHGEEYLSLTCHMFPRIENIFKDKKEISLSCGCPEVVDIISRINGKIDMISEKHSNLRSNLLELKIRKVLISIIQQENFSLEHKLIISFQMLLTILEDENFRENSLSENLEEDNLLEALDKYKHREYIQALIDMYDGIGVKVEDSVLEITNLFLDITQDYKEVSVLKILLEDICDFGEEVENEELSAKWHEYKGLFKEHDQLIENCIVSKILSSCVSDDIKDMTIAFQMIILEYLLVRYAVFLKYSMSESEKIDISDVKDYIMAFSRIIGNNTEAVIEFLRDGFGEEVLEMEYLYFISLF